MINGGLGQDLTRHPMMNTAVGQAIELFRSGPTADDSDQRLLHPSSPFRATTDEMGAGAGRTKVVVVVKKLSVTLLRCDQT